MTPARGSLDIARLVETGGLFRYRTRHERPATELWRTLTHVLFGVILGVGLAVYVVSAMMGRA